MRVDAVDAVDAVRLSPKPLRFFEQLGFRRLQAHVEATERPRDLGGSVYNTYEVSTSAATSRRFLPDV